MTHSSPTDSPFAAQAADWVAGLAYGDIPADVLAATRLRLLDVIGLALAGSETAFGRTTRAGLVALSPPGPCRILGTGDQVGIAAAAYANAALPQALEFDDTHNESIVHMSSPSVSAALAIAETTTVSGRDLLTAIALGNEISCRVGSVAPGQFHRLGFHPTGLFAPFGVAYLAGKLLGLDAPRLAWAAGICGSTAGGLLECWVDGTQTKFLHSGMAAQNGVTAAYLARAGTSGPPRVFEGRFGLFASHLQDTAVARRFERIADGLGTRWDSRQSSFKPYPAAHVLHPYLDALFLLQQQHGFAAADVARVVCPVAAFIVPIVCEPLAEKWAPATEAHCRVSLQFTIAEAIATRRLGRDAYQDRTRLDPEVLALARKVEYRVDPSYPGPGRFKGAVEVQLTDGRTLAYTQEYNRGAPENPMSEDELRAKFDDNAGGVLSAAERDRLAEAIARVDDLSDAGTIVRLAVGAAAADRR